MRLLNCRNLQWLWFSLLLVFLDLGSKYWIKTNFYIGEILYISSYCNCYYVTNAGLAFGLFSNYSASFLRWLFVWIVFFTIVMFVVGGLCRSVFYYNRYYYCAYSMVIGGAVGNLCDRILYGVVIDFIDIHINDWHWPIFNLADIEIFIGIIVLIARWYYIYFNRDLLYE